MIIHIEHLREVLRMYEKRTSTTTELLFTTVLDGPFDRDFRERVILMCSKQKSPEHLNPAIAAEMNAQACVLLWILGPVWVASGHSLPRVTGSEFKDALCNEERIDWDDYFNQFRSINPTWQKLIDEALKGLKMTSSRFAIGRISRIILSRVSPPMI